MRGPGSANTGLTFATPPPTGRWVSPSGSDLSRPRESRSPALQTCTDLHDHRIHTDETREMLHTVTGWTTFLQIHVLRAPPAKRLYLETGPLMR